MNSICVLHLICELPEQISQRSDLLITYVIHLLLIDMLVLPYIGISARHRSHLHGHAAGLGGWGISTLAGGMDRVYRITIAQRCD